MIQGLLMAKGVPSDVAQPVSRLADRVEAPIKRKVKRKVGAYQKRFGVEMKRLKKAHPRTASSTLMKRAHRAVKKVMK